MEGGGGKHPPLVLHQPKKPGANRVKQSRLSVTKVAQNLEV